MQIFDFNKNREVSDWKITNDVVMGGKSEGHFIQDENGHGVFKGNVSLENGGGFSSVSYQFEPIGVKQYSKVILSLKGDGKMYQFRVKSDRTQRHSYNYKFVTNGNWQTFEIPLVKLYPIFRGRKLDLPNFSENIISEITFLITNKSEQSFELKITSISLE